MGESSKCVQLISFKTNPKTTFTDELFQEVWIPRADELRVRGIESIALSKKAEIENNPGDSIYISKIWWDSSDALRVVFPDGLRSPVRSDAEILGVIVAPIWLTQIGCFQVRSVKVADEDVDPRRYKKIDKGDIKLYIMFSQNLSSNELICKAETLCIIKGFESYCIYELDKTYAKTAGEFCNWVIEVFFQKYFQNTFLHEVFQTGEFSNCELTMHEDILEIKV